MINTINNNMRNSKVAIIIALILFIIGLVYIIDWFTFYNNNDSLAKKDYPQFKNLYINHFPALLQPLMSNYIITSLLLFVMFSIAAVIFIFQKRNYYYVLSGLSCIGAFLMLWSIM